MATDERATADYQEAPLPGRLLDARSTDPVTDTPPAPELPEKYRDKSIEDVVKMHQEAATTIGRQSNELGELRAMVKQLTESISQPKEEPVDFWEDPEKSVSQTVQAELKGLREELAEAKAANVMARLDRDHPGWQMTASTEEFQNWVAEDPSRVKSFHDANENLNYSSADQLFKAWSEANTSAETVEQARQEAVQEDRNLRASMTESGSARANRSRALRRSEIRALRERNRSEYEARLPEITEAYAQGNVIDD